MSITSISGNQVIIIGSNQYQFLQPTYYGKSDAEAVATFLPENTSFDRISLFTDDSPDIEHQPTQPSRSNRLRFVKQMSESYTMKHSDDLWFFLSGHGIRDHGTDYLMPLDGDPSDICWVSTLGG